MRKEKTSVNTKTCKTTIAVNTPPQIIPFRIK